MIKTEKYFSAKSVVMYNEAKGKDEYFDIGNLDQKFLNCIELLSKDPTFVIKVLGYRNDFIKNKQQQVIIYRHMYERVYALNCKNSDEAKDISVDLFHEEFKEDTLKITLVKELEEF